VNRFIVVALVALLVILLSVGIVTPSAAQETPPTAVPAPLPTMMPRPAPSSAVNGNNARLELYFQTLPQGTTGLISVTPSNDPVIASLRAQFLGGLVDFFSAEDGYYALLAADMEQQTSRSTPLDVFVTYLDGTRETISTTVEIPVGAFIRQNVTLAPDKVYLLDVETERNELAQLESIFANVTEQKMWDSTGFQLPILSTLTSPFGAFRTFNNTVNTRHTGWDIQATMGTPVMAAAGGKVVFSAPLQIRGNHVVIDHGYGVYSTYSHMSVVHVTRGETVSKGQIIGEVGANGRTSGPHFHWEIAVNGHFIDSVQFIEMWMP
jgi:murein DD-endopeptidase MepM/ murein hydrolase activator NlpD